MTADGLWQRMADAIAAVGSEAHIARLIDLVGIDVPHDLVTVTRYSATQTPCFLTHRRYSDAMVRRYLDTYYLFDPFYAFWREQRRPGIVPLGELANEAARRGRYHAEFLRQSSICDEVGILIEDGGDWCIGIFLDRADRPFDAGDIARLRERYRVFAALHARHLAAAEAAVPVSPEPGALPREPGLPDSLWPELSPRERELVSAILAGHPTASIAARLGIAVGTVKNHRASIYAKLDITTERELFVQYFQYLARSSASAPAVARRVIS